MWWDRTKDMAVGRICICSRIGPARMRGDCGPTRWRSAGNEKKKMEERGRRIRPTERRPTPRKSVRRRFRRPARTPAPTHHLPASQPRLTPRGHARYGRRLLRLLLAVHHPRSCSTSPPMRSSLAGPIRSELGAIELGGIRFEASEAAALRRSWDGGDCG